LNVVVIWTLYLMQKSTLFVIGEYFGKVLDGLQMGQDTISWSNTMKYLAVVFKSTRKVVTDVE